MKKLHFNNRIINKIIILLLLMPYFTNAQPAPCMGENIIIVDGVSNVNNDDFEIYIGQISSIDSNYRRYIRPVWTEHINNYGVDTKNLILTPKAMFENCDRHTFKSKSSEKIYLVGYSTNDAVLIIKSNEKVMYLVLPMGNSNKINSYLLGSTIHDFINDNFKSERSFYHPYMYLPNIKFKEGVFFLNDSDILCEQKKIKHFQAKNIIGFYNSENKMRKSPLQYWKDTVTFYAPYQNSNNIIFLKEYEGLYTEKEAIEIIIKNGTNHTQEIYSAFRWEKYIKNNKHSESDIELGNFIYEVLQFQEQEIKKLIKLFEEGKLTKEQLNESYKVIEKEHFMLIIENDFKLMILFCHYFKVPKTSIQDFLSLFENNTYKVNRKQLTLFLEQKKY